MIPGFVISILTFPGVIVHEAAHMLFCRLRGVAVLDYCFIRVGNPAGYVIHERTGNFTTSLLISVGPFFVNSILCFVICLPAFFPMEIFHVQDPLTYVFLYLGVSIGMHAFPSTGDAKTLWGEAKEAAGKGNLLAYASYPVVGLIYVANVLSIVWFDALYGVALGVGLPHLILDSLS
jgi:hypothetical protein